MEVIKLREEFIKLGQALKAANVVSNGAEAKDVIIDGLVYVNGEIDTRRGRKLYAGDIVKFNGEEIKKRYLLWYPLIAVCSYIRVNKSDPFAAEYIIPQLIMQWTRSTNKFHNRNEILGIRYFSCASVKALFSASVTSSSVFPSTSSSLIEQT